MKLKHKSNCAARLSRKKSIVVSAALLAFFIVGLTPNGVNLRTPSHFSCNAFHAFWLFCPNGAASPSPGLRPKALPWVGI